MTATVATNSLTCTISGVIVGGIELPFNGCPKNACDHMSEGGVIVFVFLNVLTNPHIFSVIMNRNKTFFRYF